MPSVAARKSKVDPTVTFTWTNGSAFTGYLVLGTVLPELASSAWPSLAYGHQQILEELPQKQRISIIDGAASQNDDVFYTADIDPPNVKYVALLYDRNMRKVTSTVIGSAFMVASTYFTPTNANATITSAGTSLPTFD